MGFIAETARLLNEKGRIREFIFLVDGSTELLQGNLMLKKYMLLNIIVKCGLNPESSNMLKYYLETEKLLGNSTEDIITRMAILQIIGETYLNTSDYRKALSSLTKAKGIAEELNHKLAKENCSRHLGYVYYYQRDYKKAIQCSNESISISTKIGYQLGIAGSYTNLGNVYVSIGQYEKGIEYLTKSLTISIQIHDRSAAAINNENLGFAYSGMGQHKKAIEYHEKSLRIALEIGDRLKTASSNRNLGNEYLRMGQFEKAIEYYKTGLTISIEIDRPLLIADHNGSVGDAYFNMEQYDKAIEYYNIKLAISNKIDYRSGVASSIGNVGNVYCSLGEYEKAIKYCKESLTISTKIGHLSITASNKGTLANAFFHLGQHEKAIEYYNSALTIYNKIGDKSAIAKNSGNLACAYLSVGQYKKAIEFYEQGLTMSKKMGNQFGIARNTGNLGYAYLMTGQYEKAIEYCNECLSLSGKINDRSAITRAIGNLGSAYRCLGQFDKAIEAGQRSLKYSFEIRDAWSKSVSAFMLGQSYVLRSQSIAHQAKSSNDITQAISYFKMSLECGDESFSELGIDENMLSFSNELFKQYKELMRIFILFNRIEAALLIIDLGKAKALQVFVEQRNRTKAVDTMTDFAQNIWQSIENNEEKMQIWNIEKSLELRRNRSTVLFLAFDANMFLNMWVLNGVDTVKHVCLKENENLVSNETHIFRSLKMLLENFSVKLTRDSAFCEEGSSTIAEKQHKKQLSTISDNSNYVYCRKPEIFCSPNLKEMQPSDSKSVVLRYGLEVDVAKVCPLPKSLKSTLCKVVNNYHLDDHTDPDRFETSGVFVNILFKQLINPVKALIKGTKLIIVPDKFLFFVPFSALEDETNSSLSKHYSVQITPSLHTLHTSMGQLYHASLGFALFVGNPKVGKISFCRRTRELPDLPSATIEVKGLALLFDAKPLVEGKAVKKRVLSLIRDAGIIHIAAHGEPRHGEIFLAPNPSLIVNDSFLPKEESYLLRQTDVMDITTSARLVVLCCCHTGRGKTSSEGVIGLTRSFLAAGARSVLAALWPIDDEGTKIFMENFYAEICKETSVCEALRRTMNKFQQHENNECRRIKIWAPFTIYGQDVKFSKQDIEEIKIKSREMPF